MVRQSIEAEDEADQSCSICGAQDTERGKERGKEEKERERKELGQGISFQDTCPVTYFLHLGFTSYLLPPSQNSIANWEPSLQYMRLCGIFYMQSITVYWLYNDLIKHSVTDLLYICVCP
jgi:hypothetical protein